MFADFLFHLRNHGLKVSTTEWLTLMKALSLGHTRANLTHFYHLSRATLVKKEGDFDQFDHAFSTFFKDIDEHFELDDDLLDWLSNPVLPRTLSDEEIAALQALDLDELRQKFEERLKEQDERHDGGNHWVGTGGTSPFGHGGTNPAGVRVGGSGGSRSAVQIAMDRRFKDLRKDRILDTRQIGLALRRLRKLSRHQGRPELDIEETIQESARNAGEIDLVFRPPRKNAVKLLLLVDVGGSMDPHTELCERLFSAAHAASHFKEFEAYAFHNCVYEFLYTRMEERLGVDTDSLLKRIDQTWMLIIVGDAWMSPYELTHRGGAIYYTHNNPVPGIEWLRRLRRRVPRSAWLNPEPERFWASESIAMVRNIFPMYRMTIDGLTTAIDDLRAGGKSI